MAEYFGARSETPRNACLDGVSSSDIFILIIGDRGGWVTPSGKLAVEEEFDQAKQDRIPVLVFIQDTEMDEDAIRLTKTVSDYTEGNFRQKFTAPPDLMSSVVDAVTPHVQHFSAPRTGMNMVQELVKSPTDLYNTVVIRFVVAPDRAEEVIDPVKLEEPELQRRLMELGHRAEVGLFDYQRAKSSRVTTSDLIITQNADESNRDGVDFVSLLLNTTGCMSLDINVTNRPRTSFNGDWQFDFMVIVEDEIQNALSRCFNFAGAYWGIEDTYKRYDRMSWNAALGNIEHHNLVQQRPAGNSISVPLAQNDSVIIAFDSPRSINRVDLSNFDQHINAALSLFRRRFSQRN